MGETCSMHEGDNKFKQYFSQERLGELCAGDRIFKNMAWELRL
jgi:hypothetical protein